MNLQITPQAMSTIFRRAINFHSVALACIVLSNTRPAIDEQLAQRKFRAGMTLVYRNWRAMACGNPEGLNPKCDSN